MKKVIFGLVFLVLVSMAWGQGDLLAELEENWEEIEKIEMPGFAKTLFGDERINIYVGLESGEEIVLGLATEEGKFKELSMEALAEPSLNVYGTEKVIKEIMGAENPLKEFQKALEEEKITYTAVGIGNKIKFGMLSVILEMISWFS